MAVRIDASGDYERRTTGLINYQSPYTVAFWYSPASNTGASYQAIFTISGGGSAYDELFLNASSVLSLECSGNSAGNVTGRTLQVGRWYYIVAVRRSTSKMEVWVDGALDITNTTSVSARNPATAINMSLGTNAFSEWSDCAISNIKAWSIDLTPAELLAEMYEFAPLKNFRGHAWWPLLPGNRVVDWSGNGRVLTEGGTLTDTAGMLPVAHPFWFVPFSSAAGGSVLAGSVALALTGATANSGLLAASGGLSLGAGMGYGDGGLYSGNGGLTLAEVLALTDSGLRQGIASLALGRILSVAEASTLSALASATLPLTIAVQDTATMLAQGSTLLLPQLATAATANLTAGATASLPTVIAIALSGQLGAVTYEATLQLQQVRALLGASLANSSVSVQFAVTYTVIDTSGNAVSGSLILPEVVALGTGAINSAQAVTQMALLVALQEATRLDATALASLDTASGLTANTTAIMGVSAVTQTLFGLVNAGGLLLLNTLALQMATGLLAGQAVFSGQAATPDTRTVTVTVESRIVHVAGENRTVVVPEDSRRMDA